MKIKNLLLGLGLSLFSFYTQAQNGLENIIVERYYVTDATDAALSNPPVPVGSVTYRIYADMLPGYKIQLIYAEAPFGGSIAHPLNMTTSTEFWNHALSPATGLPGGNSTSIRANTRMIDSYLSVGGACTGFLGVPKIEDNGLNNFVNTNNPQLLQNNAAQAGIPLTTQDGMWAGSPQPTGVLGIGEELMGVFGNGEFQGSSFSVPEGSWYSLNGSTGPTATNRVLIAQITTDGVFHFELNIQIGTPDGNTQKYVHSSPTGVELTIPSLIQTLYPTECPSTTWLGLANTDWLNAANWSACIPQATTAVTIPAGAINYPVLTSSATCGSLTIESGASFIGSEFLTVGNALVKQNFPATGYHFISSPVQSTTFNTVFPLAQSAVWAYMYDEPSGIWLSQTIGNTLGVGTGYSVLMDVPQTALFTGQLNTVPVTYNLSNQYVGSANKTGWNLIGNPFSSAIDWDNLILTNTDAAVYVWNGSSYVTYVPGVGGDLTGGIIPSVNGFFVKANSSGASVTIPLNSRVHNTSIPFFKDEIANLLSLKASANNFTDKTFIHFNESASSGFDSNYDAYKLMGIDEAPELYSMIPGEILSINALPEQGNEIVDLGFKCGVSGVYALTAEGVASFESNTPVWIEDLKTGAFQNLHTDPEYSFNYTTGDSEMRFRLHFKSANGIQSVINNEIIVYSELNTLVIKNSTNLYGEVMIFDLTGRELLRKNMNSQPETRILLNVTDGIYLVKVITEKGITSTKVFIR